MKVIFWCSVCVVATVGGFLSGRRAGRAWIAGVHAKGLIDHIRGRK